MFLLKKQSQCIQRISNKRYGRQKPRLQVVTPKELAVKQESKGLFCIGKQGAHTKPAATSPCPTPFLLFPSFYLGPRMQIYPQSTENRPEENV